MVKLCYSLFILVYIFNIGCTEDEEFTSPVKKKNKPGYLNFAGKTYYFGTLFKANFYQSLQYCRQQNMQLVSINTPAENDRLAKFATEIGQLDGHFWTSGTNLGDKIQWIWLSTGSKIVYSNWWPGEPSGKGMNGAEEHCMEVRGVGNRFNWNDRDCDMLINFICETASDCDT